MRPYQKCTLLLSILFSSFNAFGIDELTLKSESSYNPNFENRLSFLYGVNPSITKASDVNNISFSYAKKFDDFWFDCNLYFTNGIFKKITTNNSTATGLSDNQLQDTKSNLITFGAGVGRQSQYIQTLLPFKDFYEFIATDLTYNIYKESTSSKSFSGPGLIAKFSLLKKLSDYYSLGAQFTYNLAVVKRAHDSDSETSSMRSLTMSHLTVGFDFSIYL
jgi:hypothetical protein